QDEPLRLDQGRDDRSSPWHGPLGRHMGEPRRRPDEKITSQAAEKGPAASLAPSAARSTYKEYASRAAVGRRLASGPFCAACGFIRRLLESMSRHLEDRHGYAGARGASRGAWGARGWAPHVPLTP